MAKKRSKQDEERIAAEKKLALPLRERLMRGMAHPLRLEILTLLNDREWSPRELADHLAKGLSQVSYHVKVLLEYGLIELTRTEPRRGAVEHFYRATTRTIITKDMARQIPRNGRQGLIGLALEEIGEDVAESLSLGLYDSRDDYHAVYMPMIFDAKGCEDGHELGDEYMNRMLKIAGESATRLGESDDPEPFGMSAALLYFRSAKAEREKEPGGDEKGPASV
jgi:DNA-binding transcriptional ArsR family regulator